MTTKKFADELGSIVATLKTEQGRLAAATNVTPVADEVRRVLRATVSRIDRLTTEITKTKSAERTNKRKLKQPGKQVTKQEADSFGGRVVEAILRP